MPIIKSAKKAMRVSARRKGVNDKRQKTMRELMKKLQKISKTDKNEAAKLLARAYQSIDKAAKGGVIKKNTAARKKSRLAKLVK